MAENKNSDPGLLRQYATLIFFFLATYFVIYILSIILPSFAGISIRQWEFYSIFQADYMMFIIPIPGFFLTYLLIDWVNQYFKEGFANKIWFPLLLVVLSVAAYYVVLFYYYSNLAALSGVPNISEYVIQLLEQIFWARYFDSHFLIFTLSAIGGWAANTILKKVE